MTALAGKLARTLLLTLIAGAATAAAADWPQWRGPDGAGVAPDSLALPETWGPATANIRWRTAIPGEGISSPIAVGDRVIVTTAYEGADSNRWSLAARGTAALLGAVVALLAVARLRKIGGGNRRATLLVAGGSLLFALLAVALAVAPDLFFEAGHPSRIWRVGSSLALLGLAAAFGWLRPASRWRLLGAAVLLLGAFAAAYWMPATKLGPVKPAKRLVAVLPGLVPGIWYAFRYLAARGGGRPSASAAVYRPLNCLPTALLAVLVFALPNYLDALQRVVVGLDLQTGELLWETPVLSAPPEQKWPHGTYARPTPASDGERVFAYFGAGLAAVDLDGRRLWVERFPGYSKSTRYGAASSPIVAGDAVIVVQEKELYQDGPPSWIAAFDRKSGRTLWRVQPPEAHDSYATPTLLASGPGPRLLTATWHLLVAYDARTGERLWSLEHPLEQLVASFARSGDLLAVTGGVLGEKELIVLELAAAPADAPPEVLWRSKRGVAAIASPVLYEGKLFTVTDSGIMTCYDARDGTELWKRRLPGEYFASLVAGDGKVFATNTEGVTTVIAAEAEFREIATNQLGDTVYATPAIAPGCLLIRTAGELFCVGTEGTRGPTPAGAG